MVNRMSATRCWLHGVSLGATTFNPLSDLESSQELDAFVDVTPDTLPHNIQSEDLWNWKTVPLLV